jgi:hypothetical protein
MKLLRKEWNSREGKKRTTACCDAWRVDDRRSKSSLSCFCGEAPDARRSQPVRRTGIARTLLGGRVVAKKKAAKKVAKKPAKKAKKKVAKKAKKVAKKAKK